MRDQQHDWELDAIEADSLRTDLPKEQQQGISSDSFITETIFVVWFKQRSGESVVPIVHSLMPAVILLTRSLLSLVKLR